MASNTVVHSVADRLPEANGPRVVLFYQGSDPFDPVLHQPLFGFHHQLTGNSSPSVVGVNDQPVHVASPTVETADH